jgi:hypothetical protein
MNAETQRRRAGKKKREEKKGAFGPFFLSSLS